MTNDDPSLTIPNARLLSAIYFALLAILTTIVVDLILYSLAVQLFPIFQTILLAVLIAACFGALFGKRIVHCPEPYRAKVFLWGFLMVICALPFYSLGIILLLKAQHMQLIETANLQQLALLYLFVLLYSFILAGLWLAIAAGFAAMYLRGSLVYDILHSENQRKKDEEHNLQK